MKYEIIYREVFINENLLIREDRMQRKNVRLMKFDHQFLKLEKILLTNPEECFRFLFDLVESTAVVDLVVAIFVTVAFTFDNADVSPDVEHPFCLRKKYI